MRLMHPFDTHFTLPKSRPTQRLPIMNDAGSLTRRHVLAGSSAIAVGFVAANLTSGTAHAQSGPLASWNEGRTKTAILNFVDRVTKSGSPDFVPLPDRIAVFDNDG